MKVQKYQCAEIKNLNEYIAGIDKDVTYLFDKSEFLEEYGRRDNLEFQVIPETEGENTTDVIRNILSKIDIVIPESSISVSHSLPGKPGQAKPIFVKFTNRSIRDFIYYNRKKFNDKSIVFCGYPGITRCLSMKT